MSLIPIVRMEKRLLTALPKTSSSPLDCSEVKSSSFQGCSCEPLTSS